MTTRNVYLAGPFFSPEQIDRLKIVKDLITQNPTIGEIFEPMENQQQDIVDKYGDGNLNQAMRSVQWQDATFNSDVHQIDMADIVIAVRDFDVEHGNRRPDEGTMWELGYAYAKGKPFFIVEFAQDDEPMNLMLTKYTGYFWGEEDIQKLATYNFISQPKFETNKEVF
ncbi:MAG: nucleoside 2-deoxyribosyltransferase [Lactobacillaceae bacterium]|jgi:nucleoside deoxyribosyltransferase|nr:nucleoside 2-deoxyribosyltransferase [Lactobacillaceae bacterium]